MKLKELMTELQEGLDAGLYTEDMYVGCMRDDSRVWDAPCPEISRAYFHPLSSDCLIWRPYKEDEKEDVIPIISL